MTKLIRLLEAVWIVIHWAMLMPLIIICKLLKKILQGSIRCLAICLKNDK